MLVVGGYGRIRVRSRGGGKWSVCVRVCVCVFFVISLDTLEETKRKVIG